MKATTLLFSLLLYQLGFSQNYLTAYVAEGLTKNEILQQKNFEFQKSIWALKEARALFLPKSSVMADYFLAAGGRTVDFPAGDLLNPVYSSLNQLTGSSAFPQLENQKILLNPNNFYDVKVRTTMPLFNAEIIYNKRIKGQQIQLKEIEIEIFKKELTKDIKIAYYQYLKSIKAVEIYQLAIQLISENQRINEILLQNGKSNISTSIRAENEVEKYKALLQTALHNQENAKAYFNFLINRSLTESISIDSMPELFTITSFDSLSIDGREELTSLNIARQINQNLTDISKAYLIPKANAFVDLGSQSFDFQFDQNSAYYFLGFSLQWELFSGGKNNAKVQQQVLDNKVLDSQYELLRQQLQLNLSTSYNQYQSAWSIYQSKRHSLISAKRYHQDIMSSYKNGQAIYIEWLEAQNLLIQTELETSLSFLDFYIKSVELERAHSTLLIK